MRFVAHSIVVAWVSNRHWMAWNLFLAAVPAVLAHSLFRPGRRPTKGWWVGLGLFALFLPNAPYVISDLIHLPGNLATAPTRSAVVLGFLPSYATYILVGVLSYAYCLHRLRRWLVARSFDPAWVALEIAIDLTASVGVLIGRVGRLNSWDAFVHPRTAVWTSLTAVSRPAALLAIVVFAGLLFVGCRALSGIAWMGRAVADAWAHPGGRLARSSAVSGGWRQPLVLAQRHREVEPLVTSLATADGAVAPLPVHPPGPTFETLFRTHYDGLVRLSIVFGMSLAEAEEVVQDAFLAYSRAAPRVTVGRELAYVRRSTINGSLDRHRRARRAPVRSLEPADEWLSETDVIESLGNRSLVREAVWALPPRQRACVVLRFIEGLNEAETADALEVSVGTVKKQMSRARATLRTYLEDGNAAR